MDIKNFLSESRAVSPVIGVILMVAITVILAAVIGTFVLGLGDQVGDTAPQASFTFDHERSTGNLTITHESGAAIDPARVTISGPIDEDGDAWNEVDTTATEISAGSSITVVATGASFDSGETVRVVWTSESGSNSATLQRWTYNA
ncbi:type IV pilin [Haloferax sp. KTX1]|uniref:type IV pilin n=1 Tax=Haloferax sp. KTX1 TaxID=2600597 RepID=UPI0011DD0DC6|nr:type IV pilin N-terminal domain-containing protein [Haloferax sp. KTX1]